jgi:glutamate decarboxylase
MSEPIPKFELPADGLPAPVAEQVIKDMRALDARPNLNLASFVTTWMEPEARQLIMDAMNVNFVNTEEYPSCTTMANRCVAMLGKLFHVAGEPEDAIGAPCVGSSEAILLCGLAMKKRWVEWRGKSDAGAPNLVMSAATHVCWEKFCRYWDVEPRYVKSEERRLMATPKLLEALCDQNTIGVVAVFGSTYNGEFEDVEGIDAMVSKLNKLNGWRIGVHVDAASGGFIAPFVYPDIKFDFRLPNVVSINTSGHKYGLVFPGIGWALWRSADHLPESMVFYADYLGSLERTITLNFSRSSSQVVGQYYQFLRLGFSGYRKIMANLIGIAKHVRKGISGMPHFEVLSKEIGIPLVAFRLRDTSKYNEHLVSDRLRMYGWVVPAYSMPKGAEKYTMMRVTIREDFSMSMADQLLDTLRDTVAWLDQNIKASSKASNNKHTVVEIRL